MDRGRYIVLEGGDGCGKDTQLPLVKAQLEIVGWSVQVVREPYDSPNYGTVIQDMLHARNGQPSFLSLSWQEQARLMNAARAEIMAQIQQLLLQGINVLSSRNWFSTMAYQGHQKGLSEPELGNLRVKCLAAGDGLCPDLLILIDLPASEALARQGNKIKDVHEKQTASFHEEVRDGYLYEIVYAAQHHLFPSELIEAAGISQDEMLALIWEIVNRRLFDPTSKELP